MHENVVFENDIDFNARIKVIGVGGGGCNAVNSLLDKGLTGIEFFAVNTDAQALLQCRVPNKIAIGRELTRGRGAGGDPAIGSRAAVDAKDEIERALHGADMVFVAAGLGGGTGTGAVPVVAETAKSMGILTIAVVSRPFKFEGPRRMRIANEGLERLREFVDTCIVVSNDRLAEVGKTLSFGQSFDLANQILLSGVGSINDLISRPGLINVDFADVRAIMNETGGAVLGVGMGKGENRATEAVTKATKSPLLDQVAIDHAKGVLICITGGPDMTMQEVSDAMTMVHEHAAPDANIIFGAVIDDTIDDEFRVTIIATGFEDRQLQRDEAPPAPAPRPALTVARPPAPRPAPPTQPVSPAPASGQVPQAPAPAPAPASDAFSQLRSQPAPVDESKVTQPRLPRAADSSEDLETPPYLKQRRKNDMFES